MPVKRKWSEFEDMQLYELIKVFGTNRWPEIGTMMLGRTGRQCRERWNHRLNPVLVKGNWTKEEDYIILNEKTNYGGSWAKLSRLLPGRNDNDIRNRYFALTRNGSSSASSSDKKSGDDDDDGDDDEKGNENGDSDAFDENQEKGSDEDANSQTANKSKRVKLESHYDADTTTAEGSSSKQLKNDASEKEVITNKTSSTTLSNHNRSIKLTWTEEEDKQLQQLMTKYGTSAWLIISQVMKTKTAKACRDRWNYKLNPDITKVNNWTPQEDNLIIAYKRNLLNWSKISKLLPERTETEINNRYNVLDNYMSAQMGNNNSNINALSFPLANTLSSSMPMNYFPTSSVSAAAHAMYPNLTMPLMSGAMPGVSNMPHPTLNNTFQNHYNNSSNLNILQMQAAEVKELERLKSLQNLFNTFPDKKNKRKSFGSEIDDHFDVTAAASVSSVSVGNSSSSQDVTLPLAVTGPDASVLFTDHYNKNASATVIPHPVSMQSPTSAIQDTTQLPFHLAAAEYHRRMNERIAALKEGHNAINGNKGMHAMAAAAAAASTGGANRMSHEGNIDPMSNAAAAANYENSLQQQLLQMHANSQMNPYHMMSMGGPVGNAYMPYMGAGVAANYMPLSSSSNTPRGGSEYMSALPSAIGSSYDANTVMNMQLAAMASAAAAASPSLGAAGMAVTANPYMSSMLHPHQMPYNDMTNMSAALNMANYANAYGMNVPNGINNPALDNSTNPFMRNFSHGSGSSAFPGFMSGMPGMESMMNGMSGMSDMDYYQTFPNHPMSATNGATVIKNEYMNNGSFNHSFPHSSSNGDQEEDYSYGNDNDEDDDGNDD